MEKFTTEKNNFDYINFARCIAQHIAQHNLSPRNLLYEQTITEAGDIHNFQ